MPEVIISYREMCDREGVGSLQRGMNFRLSSNYSVILMSVREGAPYFDTLEDEGTKIIYEGHDVPRSEHPNPKQVDQKMYTTTGNLTQNGKFFNAAENFKNNLLPPERVRVYEKLKIGIWSYNGIFHLVDTWVENSNNRKVFKFKLSAVEGEEDFNLPIPEDIEYRRIIPSEVKIAVWKRDRGKCVKCGSKEDLHFDHIIPYSLGGSSTDENNIQLLCGRHNLEKSNKIE